MPEGTSVQEAVEKQVTKKKPQELPAEVRPIDEHANLITHAIGLFLAIIAAVVLMTIVLDGHSPIQIFSCAVYSFSLIALYAASTLSHSFHDLAWRRFFRTVDQACIFLLIVGSFTPFAAAYLSHGWWPLLIIAMWLLAIVGISVVIYMRNLTPTAKLAYGMMGWLPIISLPELLGSAPGQILLWILIGGVFYSVGTIFLRYGDRIRYFHALWHTFVIAGTACHYIAILDLLKAW